MSHLHLTYKKWIEQEAAFIRADGCTGITNHDGICCLIHDLEYHYAKDSVSAYGHYINGIRDYWAQAKSADRKFIDNAFIRCNHRESWLGYLNPFAWWRRLVKIGGQRAWDKHRERERNDSQKSISVS